MEDRHGFTIEAQVLECPENLLVVDADIGRQYASSRPFAMSSKIQCLEQSMLRVLAPAVCPLRGRVSDLPAIVANRRRLRPPHNPRHQCNGAEESNVDRAAGTKPSRPESGRQTRQHDNHSGLPGCEAISLDLLIGRGTQCNGTNETVQERAAFPL